jgi:hypothetical protein
MTTGDGDPGGHQLQLTSLLEAPREDIHIEIKGWLNLADRDAKANLAKAVIALANTGGGYVLIGFREFDGRWLPTEAEDEIFDLYHQDAINSIVQRYADPAFHCKLYHVRHPQTGREYPVVDVPGGRTVPVRAKHGGPNRRHLVKNGYYLRRPGPCSKRVESAAEWDQLIRTCVLAAKQDLLDNIRGLLLGPGHPPAASLPQTTPWQQLDQWFSDARQRFETLWQQRGPAGSDRYPHHGRYVVGYLLRGQLHRPSPDEFLTTLRRTEGHETGWPPWVCLARGPEAPEIVDGRVECWLATRDGEPAESVEFWTARPDANCLLLRGFQEDRDTRWGRPGTLLDVTLPIWRMGECLLHAHRLARGMGDESAEVFFRVRWEGLAGRRLVNWAQPTVELPRTRPSDRDAVSADLHVSAGDIPSHLPERVGEVLRPLLAAFGLFRLPLELIREELQRMTRRRD